MLLILISLFVCSRGYYNDIFNHFPPTKLNDYINDTDGLTDEELSFQFTISWETFLNPGVWLEDWDLQSNPSQGAFDSLRYQLGFATYSAASVCYKTPAYRQVCSNTMSNAIERMLDNVVWGKLIGEQWGPHSYRKESCSTPNNADSEWGAAPTFPDPVVFQNIMYSGHLAQMLVLFEAVSNNDTYSVNGFDLVYNETTSFHYTTGKLLDALAVQQLNEDNKQGGIPCEPFLVFTECNQHQQVAFIQYHNAIANNEDYKNAAEKFGSYLVNECPKDYDHGVLEGWVQGIYLQDKASYFIDDQGDGNWSEEHWNCGYNNGKSGFSGIPNVPPRDIWVASMAYLWLSEKEIDEFVCNSGLMILLDDRLWHYSPPDQYDGWVLRNNLDLGIGFGSAMYTIGGKQCLWFNEKAGKNVSKIEERVDGTINYLINRWGGTVPNRYNLSAPLLFTKNDDNGFGAPIMDTANMLTGMTLYNDSWRQIHTNKWPLLQTSMELLKVDYPNIMVRFAKVMQAGFLQFEIVVAVPENVDGETEMVVKLDGDNNLNTVTMNGNNVAQRHLTVKDNMLTINVKINVDEAAVFQVMTSNYS